YLLILFMFNYTSYQKLGAAYAIQARYTYPLLMPMFVLFAYALNLVKIPRKFKVLLVCIGFLGYAWGGGIVGWIIRSDSLWYRQNPTVISVNENAQKLLKIVVPH